MPHGSALANSKAIITAAIELGQLIDTSTVDLFVVAGSGFRDALPNLESERRLPMKQVPHLPAPAVAGHGSELIYGYLDGRKVLIATGRVHMYEGYTPEDVVFATRMVRHLKCQAVILTNAAGSVDHHYPAGSLMALRDQMNLTGKNCETTTPGTQAAFTDMTDAYDTDWRNQVMSNLKFDAGNSNASSGLLEGVYAGLTGPSYETRAEALMIGRLGANAVGMSTVQECIAARTVGMKVFGLSLITNMAGGLGGPVNHTEVLAVAQSKTTEIKTVLAAAIAAAPLR